MPETGSKTRTSARAKAKAKAKAKEEPPVREVPTARSEAVCTVAFCPICLAVTAAQSAAPDAVDHLLRAAREFFLAARAVIDARADDLGGADASTRLERVEIA
ncbi:MAG TPA: hypothetical protein VF029_03280 [Actinomycetota bacterium]